MAVAVDRANALSFSINLEEQTLKLLSFLKHVSSYHQLHEVDVIARALYRYEKYWLPLAAAHRQECLSAPPDIQYVWYCHMLSPDDYRHDCISVVHVVINHKLVDQEQYNANLSISENYWKQKYKSSKEPFYAYYGMPFNRSELNGKQSKISCNILKVAELQRHFYLQVSLVHFKDNKYLKESLVRYRKYLVLKSLFPEEIAVPANDIVLAWHAHKLNPLSYIQDTEQLFVNDTEHEHEEVFISDDQHLKERYTETCTKWKATFEEPYPRFGSIYKGYPSNVAPVLYKMSEMDCYNVCTKETIVSMKKLVLHLPTYFTGVEFKKLQITATTCAGKQEMFTWFTERKISDGAGTATVQFRAPIEELQFDTRMLNSIKFELNVKVGGGCRAVVEPLCAGYYDILTPIESMSFMGGGTFRAKQSLTSDVTLYIDGLFSPPTKGPIWLQLKRGDFNDINEPEDLREVCDLIGIETPEFCENCQMATHRLENHAEKTAFTVKVFHLLPMMMSVVQVMNGANIVATVHLLSSERLPLPSQVNEDIISLDPQVSERAVVIRNSSGDWAIVKAKWNRSENRAKDTSGGPLFPRGAGTMSITIHKTSTDQSETTSLANTDEQYSLLLGSLETDIKGGSIDIEEPGTSEVSENIALTFAISLLHVLLVPRPKNWKPGQRIMSGFSDEETKTKEILLSDDMEFILASGLLCNSPSNQYIREGHGENAFVIYDSLSEANGYVRNLSDYLVKETDDNEVNKS